jgi:hypothetical protein
MPDADSASEGKTFYTHIPVVMAGGKKLPELDAFSKIVHEGMAPAEAFDLYTMIKHTQAEAEPQPMS